MGRLDAASLFSEKIRPCFQTGIEHGRHHGRVVDPPFSDSERIRPWPPSGFGYMRPLSLRKDQTMFSDRNRPWTPSRSGRGSSVPRLRADQAIDAIMVWLDALSLFSEKIRPCSQTGIDHGRHRSRGRGSSFLRLRTDQIMDAIMVWLDPLSLFSRKRSAMFSDRNRPWAPSRSGRGSSVLEAAKTMDTTTVWLDAVFSEKIRRRMPSLFSEKIMLTAWAFVRS